MLLGMESSDSRMNRLARNEIYSGRDIPLEEIASGNRQRHQRSGGGTLRAQCFDPSRMGLVLLGDLRGVESSSEIWSSLG